MLLSILIIILLLQFVKRPTSGSKKGSFFVQHRMIIGLLVMTIVPILTFNYLLPKNYLESSDELIEYGIESENMRFIREGFEQKMWLDPKNISLKIDYVDASKKYSTNDCEVVKYTLDYPDTISELLTETYIDLTCSSKIEEETMKKLSSLDETHFKNFLIGYYYLQYNNSLCEGYLKKEIVLNPDFKHSYNQLCDYYFKNKKTKELNAFISHPNHRSKIDLAFREYYHFSQGNIIEYTHTIYDGRIKHVQFFAFFPALIISFIWLIYLWKIDVFNPEKWHHLLFVFSLGTIFTFLCLPLYDIARYWFHFGINGEATNDFMYSFIVIGGSEELVKFLPWFLFAIVSKRLKEPFDYILYASVAALGFAFAENWMYLENVNNITIRGLMSTVGHMFDASIIAYSYILCRFRYKDKKWRILLPFAGFILAALSHGFYDFWLISPAIQNLSFVTMIFFVISLHIWFLFKNNALNHSTFHMSSVQLNTIFLQDLITVSMIGLFMLEYTLFSLEYGAIKGNKNLVSHASVVALFIIYFNHQVDQLKIKKGIWDKFSLKLPPIITSFFSFARLRNRNEAAEDDDRNYIGKSLTFYTSKSNKYIGNQLPISGTVTHSITVDDNESWYAVELHTNLIYSNYVKNCALIHVFNAEESLLKDKVQLVFLLVPNMELLKESNLKMKDFRYTGKVYSRPKHPIF